MPIFTAPASSVFTILAVGPVTVKFPVVTVPSIDTLAAAEPILTLPVPPPVPMLIIALLDDPVPILIVPVPVLAPVPISIVPVV